MFVNTKMIPVETAPGIGGGENEREQWRDEFRYGIFDILQEPL
jgi:hypothetical protein